ncbi:CAP domain-containing protein [Nocardiopsis sp. NPDC007018]|uniref:CAP domain-containing protein n=1 Tax=Nocardiopsis sp. NPDC007018 TaxID=3155721 RepID=UPI0033EF40D5
MAAMVAVPVGLTLAGALVLSGLVDPADPAEGTNAADARGGAGSTVGDAANAPGTDTGDDFFSEPTGSPESTGPRGDGGPRTSTVTASSSAEESEEADSDQDAGGDGGSGSSGGGGGNDDGGASAGGPGSSAVVTIVNSERAANGCGPLRVDSQLTAAAQEHSEDMAARDYMSHDNPEGEGPGDRAERHGYGSWGAENVAKGQTSAEQVMDAWMNSPGHRANILNCDLVAIGVGESDNAWTQKFGFE